MAAGLVRAMGGTEHWQDTGILGTASGILTATLGAWVRVHMACMRIAARHPIATTPRRTMPLTAAKATLGEYTRPGAIAFSRELGST
jgi:hypothetical protein